MYIAGSINFDFSENQRGNKKDLAIFSQNRWLYNTDVKYLVEHRSGRWYLSIIFISIHNPLRLICNYINHYESLNKAELYGQFFQKGIRKTTRGNLKLDENAYNICYN
ncbi:hypothetical protein [Emticicia sp. SJ17W-69]|uniref:hypothetical protein n=1 Tax=Emticicia sp. SJ17W-69 TaxID=3421657 RepID=UPI003EBE5BDC